MTETILGEVSPADAALWYAVEMGWAVLPVWWVEDDRSCACGDSNCSSIGKHPIGSLVRNGVRNAAKDPQVIRSWFARYPNANVGVATGRVSGFFAVDVDPRHGGDETIDIIESGYGRFPETVEQLTGGGGRHLLFAHPGFHVKGDSLGKVLGPGVDIRGDGNYIVVEPSNHVHRHYEFELSSRPGEVDIVAAPEWLVERLRPQEGLSTEAVPVDREIQEGSRNATLASLAGSMRRKGMSASEIEAALQVVNAERCNPPLDRCEVAGIARSISRYPPAEPVSLGPNGTDSAGEASACPPVELSSQEPQLPIKFLLTCLSRQERGDGELLQHIYRNRVLFDHSEQNEAGWHFWNGNHWQHDRVARIKLLISGQAAAQYLGGAADLNRQASTAQESGQLEKAASLRSQSDAMAKRARDLRRRNRAGNALDFAASLVGVTGDVWDAKPLLLPVKNGVVDLPTGELRPGKPKYHIRTVSPVEWQGIDAPCPRFEAFVTEIMNHDEAMVGFLQRLFGYASSGLSTEHVFPILWGETGRNGKDTLLETIGYVLGPLAAAVTKDTVMDAGGRRSSGAAEPHIYDLKGKRLVWASEPREDARLDAAQVKLITGGGTLKARPLYGNLVEWEPTHLVMLVTNPRPEAPADDEALWARIRLIPFTQRFVNDPMMPNEHKADPLLREKLKTEASGILAWLVRGFIAYQQLGLADPESVRSASKDYRHREDVLSHFLDDRCEEAANGYVAAGVLFEAYKQWCADNGLESIKGRPFGEMVAGRFLRQKHRTGRVYAGLKLKPMR